MALQNTLLIYKKLGQTPLEAMDGFRKENPDYADVPMTYAGRLDPMAEGLLVILTGEECKNKDKYLGLSKAYEGEILLGISTDTGDILGIPKVVVLENSKMLELDEIRKIGKKLEGNQIQEYPSYSSKTVAGKPLWKLAREGRDTNKPTRKIEVYSFEVTGLLQESRNDILAKIETKISTVKGDFRQEEIMNAWQELKGEKEVAQVVSFRCRVSSGTYVRVLAEKLGLALGTPACLFSLKRTKVGKFSLKN